MKIEKTLYGNNYILTDEYSELLDELYKTAEAEGLTNLKVTVGKGKNKKAKETTTVELYNNRGERLVFDHLRKRSGLYIVYFRTIWDTWCLYVGLTGFSESNNKLARVNLKEQADGDVVSRLRKLLSFIARLNDNYKKDNIDSKIKHSAGKRILEDKSFWENKISFDFYDEELTPIRFDFLPFDTIQGYDEKLNAKTTALWLDKGEVILKYNTEKLELELMKKAKSLYNTENEHLLNELKYRIEEESIFD